HLRERGHRAGAVLRERRGVRSLVPRQGGQVSGAARHHPASPMKASMSRRFLGALALAHILVAPASSAPSDSTWTDHWRAGLAAHARGDIAGFRAQVMKVRDILGETPGVTYQLARADARAGDPVRAIAKLHVYAAAGLVRDVAADSDFVALHGVPEFDSLAAR